MRGALAEGRRTRAAMLVGAALIAGVALIAGAALLVAIAFQPAAAVAAAGAPSSGGRGDARVQGAFAMLARLTVAVNVRGERRGELLHRPWTVSTVDCHGSVCQRLRLRRQRADEHHSRIVLHRVGPGRYAGTGRFFFALRCLGRTYRRGGVARYRITLAVVAWTAVQDVRFARRIKATYSNPGRIDRTPCPLGPSHDAARYEGSALTPLPAPPQASFTSGPGAAPDTFAFTDTSRPGNGGAAIVSRLWSFGDPASGSEDTSRAANPVHRFTAPGSYQVSLTVTDASRRRSRCTSTSRPGRCLPGRCSSPG